MAEKGPVCPECGGKIAETATYCMHCSADLDDGGDATNASDDAAWGETARTATTSTERTADASPEAATAATPETETDTAAAQQELPPELRSTSGSREIQLVPDDFFLKAGTFLLALLVGSAAGIGSALALTAVTANVVAFLVAVVVWVGATAAALRVVPG